MKNNLTCEIVEDLMPSYIDGLTNEVTNGAVREHLANCTKCNEKLSGMKEPYSEEKIAEERKEIDFLKKARRKNRRTMLMSLVSVILVIVLAVCTLPYIPTERIKLDDLYYNLEVEDDNFIFTALPKSNEIKIEDIVLEDYIKGRKIRPFEKREVYRFEISREDLKTFKILDTILWEDGEYIPVITAQAYHARNPYIDGINHGTDIAKKLGVDKYVGPFTTVLRGGDDSCGLELVVTNPIMPKQLKDKTSLMKKYSYVLLGIIDNLQDVTFAYDVLSEDGKNERESVKITTEKATKYFGENIKNCSKDIMTLQNLMDKTELIDMPYAEAEYPYIFEDVAEIKVFNATNETIKKIEFTCKETEDHSSTSFGNDFNIGKKPSVTDAEATIHFSRLSENIYDESRLGNVTVEVKVYDWDDNVYTVKNNIEVSAAFGAVYEYNLIGDFKNGFTLKQ